MASSALADLSPENAPEMVVPIEEDDGQSGSMLDSLGRVKQTNPDDLPLFFQFSWQGVEFKTEVARTADGQDTIIGIHADIGTLPFSAENTLVRSMLIERIRNSQFNLGREIALTTNSVVRIEMKTRMPRYARPVDAVQAVGISLLLAREDLNEIRAILGTATH